MSLIYVFEKHTLLGYTSFKFLKSFFPLAVYTSENSTDIHKRVYFL